VTAGARWAGLAVCLSLLPVTAWPQQDAKVLFAVVTKVPKDKHRVTVQISDGGPPSESILIPTDAIMENPVWKKLEICHALKLEAAKNPDGYRVASVKVLDAGTLPMSLQSIAGDCLIRKALEMAPTGD
jgi:hypothetical protein